MSVFRYFWLFLIVVSAVFAEEEDKMLPIADVDGGVSSMVAGCVNAITGDYMEMETDLVVAGPEPFQTLFEILQTDPLGNKVIIEPTGGGIITAYPLH